MEPDFSYLFHQSSKNLSKGHPPILPNDRDWPQEWKTIYYKAYERLPKIVLPADGVIRADLLATIQNRQSGRTFAGEPISLADMGLLLKYSCGNLKLASDGKSMRRAQPSGGARFPIEIYPLVFHGNADIPAGLYHYNVKMHALDVLWDKDFFGEGDSLFTYAWAKDAACVFLMTAVFRRNQMKYGERGYRYILLEAGHIAQNLALVATALNMQYCPIGGTRDEALEKVLDIDGSHESLVYAVAAGA